MDSIFDGTLYQRGLCVLYWIALNHLMMGVEGLEPSRLLRSTDFKSAASTIPPYPQTGTMILSNYEAIDYILRKEFQIL